MADENATNSANIGSGSTDIGSGTKPVPTPTPPSTLPPPRDDDGVDDALNQTDGAKSTGGVWGRPRR